MKIIFLILFKFHISLLTLYAQPSITWQRLYDGPDHWYDGGRDICLASDGTFFVAGYLGFRNELTRIYVMKIQSNSDTVWTRAILLNGIYGGRALAVTNSGDGGFVIAGDVTTRKWAVKLEETGI